MISTPDKAKAFVLWRHGNQRAFSFSVEACLRNPEILKEFEQWYAVQRLMGLRKIKADPT